MTLDEAEKVFRGWQEYVEIANKLQQLFTVIPESFLPYPKAVLQEALNIIAKRFFASGNTAMSHFIQDSMCVWLAAARNDAEAIAIMAKELAFRVANTKATEVTLAGLAKVRTTWAASKAREQ
jgi:hypothetical protein